MRSMTLALCILLFFACAETQPKPGESNKQDNLSKDDHQYMIGLLDSITEQADPLENYHMNRQRAQYFKHRIAQETDLNAQINAKLQYALQMLYAAQPDSAITTLSALIKSLNPGSPNIPKNLKPLYDYLALAHLRKGELDNCVANHNQASCILPLSEQAEHVLPQGSRAAKELFQFILQHYPEDQKSRYLLNVAAMTLGQYPMGIDEAYRIPTDAFMAPDYFESWSNRALDLGVDVNGIAGGSIAEDFNGDGLIDLMLSSYFYDDPLRLFINKGEEGFQEVSETAGLKGISGGLNMMQTDYNNDGWADVFILRGGWLGKGGNQPNSLLKNEGDGTFTDVTRSAGLLSFHPTQTACWADFNNDGWLDVFIGNETGQYVNDLGNNEIQSKANAHPCELYLNQGDGTFQNRATSWDADLKGFVKGVVAADFDNDGWQDVYVSFLDQPNALLINQKGSGFKDMAVQAGVLEPIRSFPVVAADFNNDGWQDIFVSAYDVDQMSEVAAAFVSDATNGPNRISAPKLYINNQRGGFDEGAKPLGLYHSVFGMGINVGDVNNDGFEDIYLGTGTPDLSSIVPNRMFLNLGKEGFFDISHAGFAHIQKGHGISFADLNNDGDQDIYAVMGGAYEGDYAQNVLFENPNSEDLSWVILKPSGKSSNRPAIGSRVRIDVSLKNGSTRSIYRTIGSGGSFGANSLQLEVGLGTATKIELIEIHWAGTTQKDQFRNLEVNTTYVLEEGGTIQELKVPTFTWDQIQNKATHHTHH